MSANTAPLERLAQWMIANSFATGHGDTFEGLLSELEWQVRDLRDRIATQKEGARNNPRPETHEHQTKASACRPAASQANPRR